MLEKPLVSVVIPTCNRREILGRCLEALTKQSYDPYEVIVVDDASSDDTPHFLAAFGAQHPKFALRCLVNEHNMGANASRNRAIREARGELVAFLDSDCIAEPDWLDKLASGFDSDTVAAVTGRVHEAEPTNIYELTLKGMHRVHGRGEAPRLVAGNMCVRRDLLLQHPLDEDLKYGCDEEGIYLRLRAAGYHQRFVPDAIVRHEHHHPRESFFRQARIGGAAAAWLVYKYRLPPRLDLLPLVLAYWTLPLTLLGVVWAWIPAFCAVSFLTALVYNELFRKRKTLLETVMIFPVLLAYYHVRLAGYLVQYARLLVGKDRIERVTLRRARGARR